MSLSPAEFTSSTGVPAEAGTHFSAFRAVDRWIPAFAGMTTFSAAGDLT